MNFNENSEYYAKNKQKIFFLLDEKDMFDDVIFTYFTWLIKGQNFSYFVNDKEL